MKHLFFVRLLAIVFIICFSVTILNAAAVDRQPRWLSAKGYWVVETNGNNRTEHTVYFYNNGNQLVYRETLSGVSLKIARRNVKMKLKKILETSVAAWELKKEQTENLALLAKVL